MLCLRNFKQHLLASDLEVHIAKRQIRGIEVLSKQLGNDLLRVKGWQLEAFMEQMLQEKTVFQCAFAKTVLKKFYRYALEHNHLILDPTLGLPPINKKTKRPRPAKLDNPEAIKASPDYVQLYLQHMQAKGITKETVSVRFRQLLMLQNATGKNLLEITLEDLEFFLAKTLGHTSLGYRKTLGGAFSSFYQFAVKRGYLEVNPAEGLPHIRVARGLPRPVPEQYLDFAYALAEDEARAAISLAAMGGMRLSEVANAHMSDRNGNYLTVIGKGSKKRSIPLNEFLLADLAVLEAKGFGYYFENPNTRQARSVHYVARLITKDLPEGYTAHTLRHRAASVAYGATKDLRAIQEFLGHANVATTQIYTAVSNDALSAVGASTGFGFRQTG